MKLARKNKCLRGIQNRHWAAICKFEPSASSHWGMRTGLAAFALLLALQIGCGGNSGTKAVELDPGPGASKADKLETELKGAEQDSFLRLLNRDHFAFLALDVPAIVSDPQMKDVPWETFFEGAIDEMGEPLFQVNDVRRMVWLMDSRMFEFGEGDDQSHKSQRKSQPGLVVIVENKDRFDAEKIRAQFELTKTLSPIEISEEDRGPEGMEKKAWGNETTMLGVMLVGEKHLVVGSLESIRGMVKAKSISVLASQAVNQKFDQQVTGRMIFAPIRPALRKMLDMAKALSGQMLNADQKKMFNLPDVTESIEFSLDFSADNLCKGTAVFEDENNALTVIGQIRQLLTVMSSVGGISGGAGGSIPVDNPQVMINPTSSGLFAELIPEITRGGMQIENEGRKIHMTIRQSDNTRAIVRAMVADVNQEIELTKRIESLDKIGKAFKEYYVENESYPAAEPKPSEGKHAFSWRVEILPYLGYKDLYEQFKFDQPWDSEHNLKIAEQIPEEFSRFGSGVKTALHVAGGIGPFEGDKQLTNEEVEDDIGETILVVESDVESAVVWTQPGNIKVTENKLPALGRESENGVLTLMVDGQVRIASRTIGNKIVGMFTIAGKERITRRMFIRRQ